MAFINDGKTTMTSNALLAKHDIKIGNKLTADDLCYLNSSTGEIENIRTNTVHLNSSISGISALLGNTSDFYNNQTNMKEKASKLIGKYTMEIILKHKPIDINKLESKKQKEKREIIIEMLEASLKIEIKNNIWL